MKGSMKTFKKLEQLHRAIERMIEDETKGIETTKRNIRNLRKRRQYDQRRFAKTTKLRELKEKTTTRAK